MTTNLGFAVDKNGQPVASMPMVTREQHDQNPIGAPVLVTSGAMLNPDGSIAAFGLASAQQAGAVAAAALNATGDIVTPQGGLVTPGLGAPNTIWLGGDSLMQNAYVTTGNNFVNRPSEGWFTWFDAYLGAPFNVIGTSSLGGTTTDDFLTRQLPLMVASGARMCALSDGINNINVSLQSGAQAAAGVIACVQAIEAAGVLPLWPLLFPQTYDSVTTPKVAQCNDLLKTFAKSNKCGIFLDLTPARVDPTAPVATPNPSRGAAYSYDSPAFLHPNNLGAMLTGIYGAVQAANQIPVRNYLQTSNETVALGAGNLLLNPGFSGTGGTVSANCTGTMPDGWVIDWATRTGTGSAAAAIVAVVDPTTGLTVAQAIQVTISGSCASGDVLRITQTDAQNALLKSSLSTGNVMQAEARIAIASGANISQIAMRMQANTNESTWFGSNGQTAGTYPATVPRMSMRTASITVLGAGVASQARHDLRITFNGAGTGSVITYDLPRARKVS